MFLSPAAKSRISNTGAWGLLIPLGLLLVSAVLVTFTPG